MSLIKSDFFQNNWLNEIFEKALKKPDVVNELVDDVINQLSDGLCDDPEFKNKLIISIVKIPRFKQKLINKITNRILY